MQKLEKNHDVILDTRFWFKANPTLGKAFDIKCSPDVRQDNKYTWNKFIQIFFLVLISLFTCSSSTND